MRPVSAHCGWYSALLIKMWGLAFYFDERTSDMTDNQGLRRWICLICGFIYDEAVGQPEDGIAPGTRWEDIPPNWTCPDCDARKDDFDMVEF